MTSLALLSPLPRAFFALWTLLLCLSAIVSVLLAFGRKRYFFTAPSLLLFAPSYFAWQVLFDLALSGSPEAAHSVTQALSGVAWLWWALALAAMTVAAALLLVYSILYERSFLTPNSIKIYLDQIPCGVCCWRDNGRVLFANDCMNRLCAGLTGEPLLNGTQFHEAAADGIREVGEQKWRFSCSELTLGNERIHTMIASNISAEYAKTQALEKDRADLSRVNRELREYTLGIDDAVRHQEILQAKVNIHDEMNRLMLSTTAASCEDTEALDKIFAQWEQNALLLYREADSQTDQKAEARIEDLATALKIRLIWEQHVPQVLSEDQRLLFFTAAQEAVSNAAKHADATELRVSFAQTETGLVCRFTNDGTVRHETVSFSGGLANLSRLAERQGASVSCEAGDRFTLVLSFPL